jgi:hypothetical protein
MGDGLPWLVFVLLPWRLLLLDLELSGAAEAYKCS